MTCPECNGRGWNSDSTTLLKETCGTCSGSGEVRECDRCNGKGTVLHWSTTHEETCDKCDGQGWLRA